jgi:hypothetical protein
MPETFSSPWSMSIQGRRRWSGGKKFTKSYLPLFHFPFSPFPCLFVSVTEWQWAVLFLLRSARLGSSLSLLRGRAPVFIYSHDLVSEVIRTSEVPLERTWFHGRF